MLNKEKIKNALTMWQIGQNEFARAVGCSNAYISKFLKGKLTISDEFSIRMVGALEKLIKEKRLDTKYFE